MIVATKSQTGSPKMTQAGMEVPKSQTGAPKLTQAAMEVPKSLTGAPKLTRVAMEVPKSPKLTRVPKISRLIGSLLPSIPYQAQTIR